MSHSPPPRFGTVLEHPVLGTSPTEEAYFPVQPDPNPEIKLPKRRALVNPRPCTGRGRPLQAGAPRRPSSWRHPGGTVSETEECEFTDVEDQVAKNAAGRAQGTVSLHPNATLHPRSTPSPNPPLRTTSPRVKHSQSSFTFPSIARFRAKNKDKDVPEESDEAGHNGSRRASGRVRMQKLGCKLRRSGSHCSSSSEVDVLYDVVSSGTSGGQAPQIAAHPCESALTLHVSSTGPSPSSTSPHRSSKLKERMSGKLREYAHKLKNKEASSSVIATASASATPTTTVTAATGLKASSRDCLEKGDEEESDLIQELEQNEKSLYGSYSKGLIPIRSASFSSTERYKRKSAAGHKLADSSSNCSSPAPATSSVGVLAGPPAITVDLVGGCGGGKISEEAEDSATKIMEESESSTSRPFRPGEEASLLLGDPEQKDELLASVEEKHAKLEYMSLPGETVIFQIGANKLTRAASESRRNSRKKPSKTREAQFPASLQHLSLEGKCPSRTQISFRIPSETSQQSSREDTLSPVDAVPGSSRSSGESTETLINVEEVELSPSQPEAISASSSSSTVVPALHVPTVTTTTVYQEEGHTPELDHALEKEYGSLKQADIVEVQSDDIPPWDVGEQSLYPIFPPDFAHFTTADLVEVDELVAFGANIRAIQPVTFGAIVQQTAEEATSEEVTDAESRIYTIGAPYFVVQDFDSSPGNDGDPPSVAEAASGAAAAAVVSSSSGNSGNGNLLGLRQYHANVIEIGKDTDSGCSVTTISDQVDELLPPVQHQFHQIVTHTAGATQSAVVATVTRPEATAAATARGKAGEPAPGVAKRLLTAASVSSDEVDFPYGNAQPLPAAARTPAQVHQQHQQHPQTFQPYQRPQHQHQQQAAHQFIQQPIPLQPQAHYAHPPQPAHQLYNLTANPLGRPVALNRAGRPPLLRGPGASSPWTSVERQFQPVQQPPRPSQMAAGNWNQRPELFGEDQGMQDYENKPSPLVDLDWELLEISTTEGEEKFVPQAGPDPAGKPPTASAFRPRQPVNQQAPKALSAVSYYTGDDIDSDGTLGEPSFLPKSRPARARDEFQAYLGYDTDERNSVGEEFSGDDDEAPSPSTSPYPGEADSATSFSIQDAILRQQKAQEAAAASSHAHHPVAVMTTTTASTMASSGAASALPRPLQQSRTQTQNRAGGYGAPLKVTPLRTVATVATLSSKGLASNKGGNVSASAAAGAYRHQVIRLPRGRHPLRGPFGTLLDAQMSKSDLSRKEALLRLSASGGDLDEEGLTYAQVRALRQISSETLPLQRFFLQQQQQQQPGPPWSGPGAPGGIPCTQAELGLSPNSAAAATAAGGISHIRTRSSPSKLLGDFSNVPAASLVTSASPSPLSEPSVGVLPAKKQPDCNFADFSKDKLTVAQELLVARNPTAVQGAAAGAAATVNKSGSFRRKRGSATSPPSSTTGSVASSSSKSLLKSKRSPPPATPPTLPTPAAASSGRGVSPQASSPRLMPNIELRISEADLCYSAASSDQPWRWPMPKSKSVPREVLERLCYSTEKEQIHSQVSILLSPCGSSKSKPISIDQHQSHLGSLTSASAASMSSASSYNSLYARCLEDVREEEEGAPAAEEAGHDDEEPLMGYHMEVEANPEPPFQDTRTLVVEELYDLEKSYVESLQFLIAKYYKPLKSQSPDKTSIVTNVLLEDMFFQIPQILAHHEAFFKDLKSRLENWDAKNTVGDWFLKSFSNKPVIDTYTAFIRNVKRADEAIRIARQNKPAFDRFLQEMRTQRNGERLSLTDLLAKPHQRFPRYRLLIERLLKHTDSDHPDYALLRRAEREIHELTLKISAIQKETNEQEHRLKVIRQIEMAINGVNPNDLGSPGRALIQYDLVTMTNGPWTRKDRCLFLFNDLLLITSISKRAARDLRRGNANVSKLSSLLEQHCRQKLWMDLALEDVEISKAKEEHLKKIMKENREIEEDLATLRMLTDAAARLHCPHKELDDVTRALMTQLGRQLAERQSADTQQSMYLDLTLTTADGGEETVSVIFTDPDRRLQWEEAFTEVKQKIVRTEDKKASPEFLNMIPIRKTRSGLQFTCAAPTLGLNAHKLKDVWVCNSDGYVGQVCVLSLLPEPAVICCNGVCNARILSIVSVPSVTSSTIAPSVTATTSSSASSSGKANSTSCDTPPGHVRHPGSKPKAVPTSLFHNRDTEPSPPERDQVVVGSAPHLQDSSPNASNPSQLDSSSSEFELRGVSSSCGLVASSERPDSESSSSSDDDEEIIDDDDAEDAAAAAKKKSSASVQSVSVVGGKKSIAATGASSASTPELSTKLSSTLSSILTVGSSPTPGVAAAVGDEAEPHNQFLSEDCQATMWLGTEDGHIHIYNCTDNIRIKKNKEKFLHSAAVLSIIYLDNCVYAALGNGNIMVYTRNAHGVWDKSGAKVLPVGSAEYPVRKMFAVGGRIWCAVQNKIHIIDAQQLELITSFEVDRDDDTKSVLCLSHSGLAVWIAMEQSAKVKAFHTLSYECVAEVNVVNVVSKVLAGCDDIIRQHKSACLRITALLTCKDILWIGTSAGVIATMHLPHITQNTTKITQMPSIIGNCHGHSGHVRFLTCVEMTPEVSRTPFGKSHTRFAPRPSATNADASGQRDGVASANSNSGLAPTGAHSPGKLLVISGGDGYEDFSNTGANDMVGREDSTNHLLLWQV